MIHYIQTDSQSVDFQLLVQALDADLKVRDGDEHAFYAQFNTIEALKHVIVAYEGSTPVGCGAFKHHSAEAAEVKRMYVALTHRGRGIASGVLAELEAWASALGYSKCILETGTKQPEAIGLYQKNQYQLIANYGQYAGLANSVCFEKTLKKLQNE